jgi:thiamine-phosphate pyrophosphorylase
MDFCFYLITNRRALAGGRSIEEALTLAMEGGVRGILLREKDLPDRELFSLAGNVRDLTRRHGVRLLISGRVDVAMAVGADGVHLGGQSLPVKAARAMMGDEKYVAVSTHSLKEALDAQEDGADFITFGPVYKTPSKAIYGPPVGVATLEEVCRALTIPVFGLGGIGPDNAVEVLKAGAYGIAVISAVAAAPDPARAARDIIDRIRDYKLKRVI